MMTDMLAEYVEYTKETMVMNEMGLERVLQEVFDTPKLAWQIYYSPKSKEVKRDYSKIPKKKLIYEGLKYGFKNTLKAMYRSIKRKPRVHSEVGEDEGKDN